MLRRFTLRQIIALVLICSILLVSTPPALARPATESMPIRFSALKGFLGALTNSFPLHGATRQAEQDPGMPLSEEPPPQLIEPQDAPSQAELESKVVRLDMNPKGEGKIEVGQLLVVAAVPLDSDGNAIQGLIATWESSDQEIVTVTSDGQAKGIKPGKVLLTARAGLKEESVKIKVVERAPNSDDPRQESGRSSTPTGMVAGNRAAKDRSLSRTKMRLAGAAARAHGAKTFRARASLKPAALIIDDSDSKPNNDVGAPPGRTEPGASTPPAAVSGTETPGSANYTFDVPIASLPGRGLGVALSLIYNSRVWHKQSGGNLEYDRDKNWLAPGFRLGFGHLEAYDTLWPNQNYLYQITDADGTRHSVATGNYISQDGSFIHFAGGPTGGTATYTDGTRVEYGAYRDLNPAQAGRTRHSYPIKITERNGNYILINYVGGVGPKINSIQDTLGRYVYFKYAGNDLVTITVPGYAGGAERQAIRFYYQDITINPTGSFNVFSSPSNTTKRVLRYVYNPGTGSGYRYDYSTPYGTIYRINQLRGMTVSTTDPNLVGSVTSEGQVAAWTEYNYPTTPSALTDAPKYTRRTDDWAGRTPAGSAAPFYTFAMDESLGISTITAPDGTVTQTTMNVTTGSFNGYIKEVLVKQGTTELSKITYTWEMGYSAEFYANAPRIKQLAVKNEAGQTRTTIFSYDTSRYNNVSVVSERDFNLADGSVGPELRRTETTYEARPEWTAKRLVRLPTSVKVFAGGATSPSSYIKYAYDETGLTGLSGLTMHDPAYNPASANYDPTTAKRGNLTTITAYADAAPATPTGANVNTSAYDIVGNVITQTVNCCQQKSYTYSSAYNYAYMTQEVRGAPGTQLTTQSSYDFNTGLLRTKTDENNQQTTLHYDQANLRYYQTSRPDTSYTRVEHNDSLYADPDAARMHSYIVVSTALGPGRLVRSYQFFDGRNALVRRFDNYTATNSHETTDIEYDQMGRTKRTSNPYFSGGSGSAVNPSGLWTTIQQYDNLGRVTSVQMPDNTLVQTTYAGTTTTITDQAGKQRRQITDALGRVVRVDEPDGSGSLGATTAPTQATSYQYDALDNPVKVTHGAQLRYFKYDSLSRLTYERQVEQSAPHSATDTLTGNSLWSRKIVYDLQGRVTDTYDARNVRAQFNYDGLNRVTDVTYSGETTGTTPSVTYSYSQARAGYYNNGRLTQVVTTAGGTQQTAQAYDYDLMGRVASHRQTVGATTYTLAYGYDMAGQLNSLTYPSGRVVNYTYDDGMRLTQISDAGTTYTSALQYGAHRGLTSETWGNTAVHTNGYNDRLQVNQIKLSVGGTERQRYDYLYGNVDMATGAVDATKNNGQIGRMEGFINAVRQWQQRLSYDSLDRLDLAGEFRGDTLALVYRADYDYDRWGNRLQSGGQNYNLAYTQVTGADINTASNRYTSGVSYDAAGNVTSETKFRGYQYQYDANNRQRWSALTDGSQVTTAIYDGVGQRVQTNGGGITRNIIYDINGAMLAEYEGGAWKRDYINHGAQQKATVESTGAVRYVLADHQGSTRVVTDSSGGVLTRQDYLPFGEELLAGTGQRTSAQGFGVSSGIRQQYAGLERDASGIDHTLWRKYESRAGRWTTTDPYSGSMIRDNPQSFNRYTYAGNDPVNRVDPTGLYDIEYRLDGVPTDRRTALRFWLMGAAYVLPDNWRKMEVDFAELNVLWRNLAWNLLGAQDRRTSCDRMADDAQQVAGAVREDYPGATPAWALQEFNRRYGQITFGTHFSENPLGFLGTPASSRNNVFGTRNYTGQDGFHSSFHDETETTAANPNPDQVHHFGAYFSAGLAGHKLIPDQHRADDRDAGHMGDVRLADQSRRLGDYLRRNPGQLSNVGRLIRDSICSGKEVPK